jgi:hypothetical protein
MPLVGYLSRFNAKFKIASTGFETPCWLWSGDLIDGYGRFGVKKPDGKWTSATAHRWSYETFVGEIPAKHDVEHRCEVRNCVNPDHLRAVTRRENMLRAAAAGTLGRGNREKTHCPWGHPYDEENTRWSVSIDGKASRTCAKCKQGWDAAAYQAGKRR